MEYRTIYLNQYSSKIELTRFAAADVEEAHAILHVDANGELFESQLRRLQLSLQTFMQELEMEGHKMVFMRYFLRGGFLDGRAGWRWHFWQGRRSL